ncbi:MAG: hypothetical protein NTV22_11835 [bacterium]|nr:hypothetical protein [bacterium]
MKILSITVLLGLLITFGLAPAVQASLIMYEPFNYTLGANNPSPTNTLDGAVLPNGLPATNVGGNPSGTSTGWRGNWGTSLKGGAGHVNNATWGTGTISPYRFMTTDPFVSYRGNNTGAAFGYNYSGSLYFSLLMRLTENWAAGNIVRVAIGASEPNGNTYIGVNNGAADKWAISRGRTGASSSSILSAQAGQTVFVVGRYDFTAALTSNDALYVWFSPSLTGALGVADCSIAPNNGDINLDISGFNTRPGTANVMQFDEFRLGETLDDVRPYAPVPEPAALALLALGGLLLRKQF